MSDQKPPQSAQLVELATLHYRFGVARSGEPFAIRRDGPRIALLFRGGRTSLRTQLSALYCETEGRPPSSSALADALLALEGMAQRGDPIDLSLRTARHADEIVLDLGRPSGEVVVIGPLGWRVTTESPVHFRRTELTAPLPVPVGGGDLDDLRQVLNVNEDSWPLLVAWLVLSLLPDVPHPILLLRGEQGAGKSTTARTLASLVDPSPAPLRTAPTDVEAWAVAAAGSYVVPIDNVTTIQTWLSDALCRAVTGDGLVKRKLYSDDSLVVLAIQRVVILTSIDAGALRGDLADRLLPVDLDRLTGADRRRDEELATLFAELHPSLLGALCTLAGEVLALLPTVRLEQLPRMADAARVMAAVDDLLGTDALPTYLALTDRMAVEALESDAVATAVREFAEAEKTWEGTAGELLERIRPEHPPKGWPADAARLSGRLRRAAPTLRAVGVTVEQSRTNRQRVVRVAFGGDAGVTLGDAAVTLATPLASPRNRRSAPTGDAGDANDGEIPTPLCRTQKEKEGGGERNEEYGKERHQRHQRHQPSNGAPRGCSRCGAGEVYLTTFDDHALCRECWKVRAGDEAW